MERRTSSRILFIGYFGIAFLSGLLLLIPGMHKEDLSVIDAFFTATSAVTLTGLVTLNTYEEWSIWGKILILLLVQIGGLGYMVVVGLVYVVLRSHIDYKSKVMLKESLSVLTTNGITSFIKKIVQFVLLFEGAAAILLSLRFMIEYPFLESIWLGIFHSISAFNNAGFVNLEQGMDQYVGDLFINLIFCALIIIGGLGYFVILECYLYQKKRFFYLSIHTKIVLIATIFLLISGTLMVFLFEHNNADSMQQLPLFDQLLSAFFTSVNFRTSGFSTLDLGEFRDGSLLFGSFFMIIGGAPGGTSGGVKVTTIAVLLIYAYWVLRGREESVVFNKRIPRKTIDNAFLIIIVSAFYIAFCITFLSIFESGGDRGFIGLIFEVCSAFSTTGASVGSSTIPGTSLAAEFGVVGKFVLIIMMLSGRIGVLAFSFAIFSKQKARKFQYPEGRIML